MNYDVKWDNSAALCFSTGIAVQYTLNTFLLNICLIAANDDVCYPVACTLVCVPQARQTNMYSCCLWKNCLLHNLSIMRKSLSWCWSSLESNMLEEVPSSVSDPTGVQSAFIGVCYIFRRSGDYGPLVIAICIRVICYGATRWKGKRCDTYLLHRSF